MRLDAIVLHLLSLCAPLTSDGDWPLGWAAIPLQVVTVPPWRSGFGSACWASHHSDNLLVDRHSCSGPLFHAHLELQQWTPSDLPDLN